MKKAHCDFLKFILQFVYRRIYIHIQAVELMRAEMALVLQVQM